MIPEKNMTERQGFARKISERVRPGHVFRANIASNAQVEGPDDLAIDDETAFARDVYSSHADYLIGALSPFSPCRTSLGVDLENTGQLLKRVGEAVGSGTLTDDEALIVSEFIVSWLIGRRFDCILSDVFEHGPMRKKTFRGVLGTMTHGRNPILIR